MRAALLGGLLALVPVAGQAAAAPAGFQWSVKGPTVAAIEPGGTVPISISVEAGAANGPMILRSTLVEDATKKLVDSQSIKLCADATCSAALGPLAQGPHRLALVVSNALPLGKYVGAVTVAAAEKPDGDDVAMTLYVSTWQTKLWGVATIFLSTILAWFVTVFTRNLINRFRLQIPAARLLEALTALARRNAAFTAATNLTTPNVVAKIGVVRSRLGTAELEAAGLPPWIPNAWAATGTPSVSDYQTHIQAAGDWVTALSLVSDALDAALAMRTGNPPLAAADFESGVKQLDDLLFGIDAPKADQLTTKVNTILESLHGKRSLRDDASRAPSVAPPTVQGLEFQIGVLNLASWSFVIVATTVTGAAALIYFSDNGPGFGVARDFLTCILWGLGLPTGAGLVGSTSSSVSAAFSIAKPA